MKELTRLEIMKIAAATGCDPRTVKRFASNGSVSDLSAQAIRTALRELKIANPRTAPLP